MSTVVIYNSKTGFTKQYAKEIAEETGAELLTLADAQKKTLDGYDTIVFGSWTMAGQIVKLDWFKSNMAKWAGKKLIVFSTGATPTDSPDIEKNLNNAFSEAERENISVFYCQSGIRYEQMSLVHKLIMKMVKQTNSFDATDKKYIEPIVDMIKVG